MEPGFNSQFPGDILDSAFIHRTVCLLYVFFADNVCSPFGPFFFWVVHFLIFKSSLLGEYNGGERVQRTHTQLWHFHRWLPSVINVHFLNFFVGLEFEFRALGLQSKRSTAWATPPVHFALVVLEMGVSGTIYLGWSPTPILPISASQVAKITGMS
jgi:hypothetical protein